MEYTLSVFIEHLQFASLNPLAAPAQKQKSFTILLLYKRATKKLILLYRAIGILKFYI